MTQQFTVPDEVELMGFFGADAVERNVEDGYWCYELTDGRGVTLRFSFNVFEQSVQTAISVASTVVSIVSHEGAQHIRLESNNLECEFLLEGGKTKLIVQAGDRLSVNWATLRTQ